MVFQRLREGARAAAATARRGAFVVGALRSIGVLSGMSPAGLPAFARRLNGFRFRPHQTLMLHAATQPDAMALVFENRRYTFAELDRAVNRLCNALRGAGLAPSSRVGLMMHNGAEYLLAQEALPRLGAGAVQIGYRLKAPEVAHILENAQPEALIVDVEFEDTMAAALELSGHAPRLILSVGPEGAASQHESVADAMARSSEDDLPRNVTSDGGSVIVYTSGTTGKPKGAKRNLAETGLSAVMDMLVRVGARARAERHLVVCPLYHSAAPAFVKMTYAIGGGIVLLPRFDAEDVLATIERERVTSAFMVPTQLARLAELPVAVRDKYDTSSLVWVMSGAAPLPTTTAKRFQDAFGPILYNFYGATETGTVSLASPADHTARPGTVGSLLFDNEVLILGDDGEPVAPGEVGELYVRNPMLITGYHRNQAATDSSMRDGYFSVGDLARLDSDGYLFIESRVHDMVISGGVNIYPREIEDVLHQHPAIRDVAVVGVPDDEWGESLAAFVVAEEGVSLSEADVVECCRESLADYKRPRRVVFLDELPRNPTGKILKRVLRESA